MPEVDDLLSHARSRRVAVIGGGIAGLVAARELAKVAIGVTLFEAAERFGGTVRAAELDGLHVDVGADGFSAGHTALDTLITELGLTDARRAEVATGRWVVGRSAHRLPDAAIAGIPANPFADDVRRIIGWGGAWRAYLDRLRPPLTIGHQHSLGRLVRTRMGERVERLLVAPVSRGSHLIEPDDVDVEVVAPGLGTALTRTGSLSGAVAELLDAGRGRSTETLAGGLTTLVDTLVAALGDLGVELRTSTPVDGIERSGAGWTVHGETFDHVLVAAPAVAAAALLRQHVAGLAAHDDDTVAVVTLLVDGPVADRGGAVYPAESDAVIAVDLPGARWGSEAEGRALVRVHLRDTGTDDASLIAAGTAAARSFVDAGTVRASRVDRFPSAPPRSRIGSQDAAAAVRERVATVGGLSVAGGWVSGSGLGAVVTDATAEADRVRSALLWQE